MPWRLRNSLPRSAAASRHRGPHSGAACRRHRRARPDTARRAASGNGARSSRSRIGRAAPLRRGYRSDRRTYSGRPRPRALPRARWPCRSSACANVRLCTARPIASVCEAVCPPGPNCAMAPRAASPTMKGSPRKPRAPSKSAAKGPAASAGTLQRSEIATGSYGFTRHSPVDRTTRIVAVYLKRGNPPGNQDAAATLPQPTARFASRSDAGRRATSREGRLCTPPTAFATRSTPRCRCGDGVQLSGDIYLPDAPGQFPTALIRTPYDNNTPESIASARAFAQDGYACVVQDVRGALGLRRHLLPLPQRGRRRLRHPRVDWATTVEQWPHRHERPLLSGAGAVAQRTAGQPVSHVSGAARGMRGVSGRSGATGRGVAAHDGPHLGHAHQRPHGAEHRLSQLDRGVSHAADCRPGPARGPAPGFLARLA